MRQIQYFIVYIFYLILFAQVSCNKESFDSKDIALYLFEGNNKQIELSVETIAKQRPELILRKEAIRKVKLIQNSTYKFTIEIYLIENFDNDIRKITYSNIGKKLVFVSNAQILFAPFILGEVERGEIVIELPSIKKTDAEAITKHFCREFELDDSRIYTNKKLNLSLQKAYEFRDRREYDKAIKELEHFLKQNQDYNTKVVFYNEIALCYRLKGDTYGASDTYKKLISEPVNVDLDNYMLIEQAYLYLSAFEKKQRNMNMSKNYYNQSIATLQYIIRNFPLAISAEWASLTIGTYELFNSGNIKEAEKRAVIGKKGNFSGQGYLLLGLCYEYQKKFKKAKQEYKNLIENIPDAEESKVAQEFIGNLDSNKTNIKEFLKAINMDYL